MFVRYLLILYFILVSSPVVNAQESNPYGLKVIDNTNEYLQSVSANPDNELVEISKVIPEIKLDIRYATADNFAKQAVYSEARAFARMPVVKALSAVQAELKQKGLGLKIFDAYRPYSVTVKFFEVAENKNFVANPKTGSRHNRGCAIDLTLIKLRTGKELRMPTAYDSFAPQASADYNDLPEKIKNNRTLLINIMEKHGFKVLDNEWWHFDYKNWKEFDLMDIPFNQL
jgi:D-alanyl-D-alanine dipeptidase